MISATGAGRKCGAPGLIRSIPRSVAVSKKADRTAYDIPYSCRTEPPKMPRLEIWNSLWESVTTAEELVNDADERLFWKIRHCAHHVLDELLPPKSDAQHNLRKRRHNLTLPEKKGHLTAKNFIIRLLYKDTY